MNISLSSPRAFIEGSLRARRIVILLIVFAFIPLTGGTRFLAMAQDLPAEKPDATLAPQPQPDATVNPDSPGNGQQNLCADDAAPCVAQNSSADPQTQSESASAPSQSNGKDRFVHDFVGDFFHDEYRIWTGPFRKSNYDTHTMRKYGIPFIVISAALIATDRPTSHWFENSTGQVIWSGRVSQIGAPYTVAGISGATYLIGRVTHNDHARETGFLALEAVADSQFITLVFKEITQRQRPAVPGARHGGFWQGGSSFPSGHAAGAFAVAAVFSYEYRDHIAIPITAYSLATIVGVSRLGAQQHWLSDIFVGGAVGFLAGRYVYKQHHDPSLPGSITSKLRPQFAAREHGLGLYWDF
jgi:membrane-associated phospholipid phosphatase